MKTHINRNKYSIGSILVGILKYSCFMVICCFIFSQCSPWPDAMLTRYAFNKNGKKTDKALKPLVPSGISSLENLNYKEGDGDAYLDVYFPDSIVKKNKNLPTIFWIHGGGWVAGSKENIANYCKILSGKGFTVVSINYSVAPEHKYPTPVIQANAALQYINSRHNQLHINSDLIFIAGDSGGAHIGAQLATIISCIC